MEHLYSSLSTLLIFITFFIIVWFIIDLILYTTHNTYIPIPKRKNLSIDKDSVKNLMSTQKLFQ